MLVQLGLFIIASLVVWAGAGMVLRFIAGYAARLKISPFTLSFFVLGLLTSLPEMMIGATAVSRGEPELMIGNLIGATIVLFLLVIPLLAITGGGVKLPKDLSKGNLIFSLLVIITPSLLIIDKQLKSWEGLFLIAIYFLLFLLLSKEANFLQKISLYFHAKKNQSPGHFLSFVVGLGLIFWGSSQVVSSAEYFAHTLGWSPFIVGLLMVSIGTNIPELSLVMRSVFTGHKNIALADYIGSASANTLLIGVFTLTNLAPITLKTTSSIRLIITATSLVLFYVFARSSKSISRTEGFMLFSLYAIFVVLELFVIT